MHMHLDQSTHLSISYGTGTGFVHVVLVVKSRYNGQHLSPQKQKQNP